MADSDSEAGHASVAGVGAGMTFVGIFSHLEDGNLKSILLLLAPAITMVVSFFWNSLWSEIQQFVADKRIRSQRKKQEKLVERLNKEGASSDVKEGAQSALNALLLLEAQLAQKRVEAIIAGSGNTSVATPARRRGGRQ
jgi:hypothetical protein